MNFMSFMDFLCNNITMPIACIGMCRVTSLLDVMGIYTL